MTPGRFFKIDFAFDDFSVFSYTPVISKVDKNEFPIFVKLSSSFIGFYIHTENFPSPLSQLLFHIPIKNQYGEKKPFEILKSIYDERVYDNSLEKIKISEYKFKGYQVLDHKIEESNTVYVHKRKIFLDFLFDITHSEVFDKSKHIDEIRHFIHNNFFVNAILNKHEFLFSRREYFMFVKYKKQPPKYRRIFSIRLKEAEEKWLENLFKEDAKNFCFSNNWFNDVEEEMENIIFDQKIDKDMPFSSFNRKKWQIEYLKEIKSNQNFVINKILKERSDIFDFYISRYEFYKPYKWINKTAHLFGLPSFGFLGKCFLTWYGFLISILVFSLIMGQVNVLNILVSVGIIGIYLGILSPFIQTILSSLFSRISYEYRIYSLSTHIKVAAPKMTISILVGWLALFPFSEELWELNTKYFYNLGWYITLVSLLVILISSAIFYEVKLIEPIQKLSKSLLKVLRIFIIGFSFAVGIGIIVQHISSTYMFDNNDFFRSDYKSQLVSSKIDSILKKPEELFELREKINNFPNSKAAIDSIERIKKDYLAITVDSCLLKDTIIYLNDSSTLEKIKESIPIKIDSLADNGYEEIKLILKNYIKDTENNRNKYLPNLAYHQCFGGIFIFPQLLILNSLIAFLIGFFIQFILEAKAYRQPL